MDIIELLDKLISGTDKATVYRTRVVKTLQDGEKILTAIMGADLGDTEKGIVSRLLTLDQKLLNILAGPAPVNA